MTVALDIRIVELLCSRLCHDLVSPIGAINNGVELIEEMGAEVAEDAMGLIAHSAGQASRRLHLFRMAYGMAGDSGTVRFAQIRETAAAWLAGSKIGLTWTEGRPEPGGAERSGVAKILLNMVMLAEETLPYGGTIAVDGSGGPESGLLSVTAEGRAARLTPEAEAALAGRSPPDHLTPRTVHAYITGRFAEHAGVRLTTEPVAPERLILRLHW